MNNINGTSAELKQDFKGFVKAGFREKEKLAQSKSPLKTLIYGSASLAELRLIQSLLYNFKSHHFYIVGYPSDDEKKYITDYCQCTNSLLTFLKVEDFENTSKFYNFFDVSISLSCLFRQQSPGVYHPENQYLSNLKFDTSYPIFSDKNNILKFYLNVLEVQKLLINVTKVHGIILLYPTVSSFEIFQKLYPNNDLKLLDSTPEITYINTFGSCPPTFSTNPISFHILNDEALYSDEFIASELLREGKTATDVTYSLKEIAPELDAFFKRKNVVVVPSIYTYNSCVKKIKHEEYSVDFKNLKEPLQLETKTYSKLKALLLSLDSNEKKIEHGRFFDSIFLGGRYNNLLICREIKSILKAFNDNL